MSINKNSDAGREYEQRKQYTEAAQWYINDLKSRKGVNQFVSSAARLSLLYYYGLGVPKNKAESVYWYHQALLSISNGRDASLFALENDAMPDTLYEYDGNFDLRSTYDKAVSNISSGNQVEGSRLMLSCAIHGNRFGKPYDELEDKAQIKSAEFIFQGNGLPVSPYDAIDLLRRASRNGNSEATYKIAMLYRKGEYLKQDKDEAEILLHKAADAGSVDAKKVLYADEQTAKREQAKKEKDAEDGLKFWGSLLAAEAHAKASRSPKEKCNDRCKEEASHCEAKNRGNDFLVGTSGTFSTRGYGLAINSDCSSQLSSCLNHCK